MKNFMITLGILGISLLISGFSKFSSGSDADEILAHLELRYEPTTDSNCGRTKNAVVYNNTGVTVAFSWRRKCTWQGSQGMETRDNTYPAKMTGRRKTLGQVNEHGYWDGNTEHCKTCSYDIFDPRTVE